MFERLSTQPRVIVTYVWFTIGPRARKRFNQVVKAKRFEEVCLCRKVC